MKTVGQALFDLGLNVTNWLDAQTGAQKLGKFDPSGRTWEDRYGVSIAGVKGWVPGDAVGFHVSGDNNNLMDPGGTFLLAAAILDVPQSAWDILDVSFVDGAAAYLLDLGRKKGIIPPLGAQPLPVPVPPPALPVPPPPAPPAPAPPVAGSTGQPAGTNTSSPAPSAGSSRGTVSLAAKSVIPIQMDGLLIVSGILRPGSQEPKKGYAVLALGLTESLRRLPKRWLLFGLLARNGQYILESHGFGPKQEGHTPPIRTGVSSREPLPFRAEYDGRHLELSLGNQVFEAQTELQAAAGSNLSLILGIDPGADLLVPSGWAIDGLRVE